MPKALARARVRSYEQYAWPAPLGAAFKASGVRTAVLLALTMIALALLLAAALAPNPAALLDAGTLADFYGVVPHAAMVVLFGGVGAFVVAALAIGARRFWRDIEPRDAAVSAGRGGALRALRDIFTLRHLHTSGEPCTTAEDVRTPWRRRFHHATFYGFLLCFASTCVAALYHGFGREAPYAYASLPVLLGALGGVGLLAGPLGLLLQRRGRDPALSDPAQENLDRAFLVLLWLTSASGLLLLGLRHHPVMGILLLVHLGVVLALFVTLPYGKFVHGIYRAAALLKHAREQTME